MINDFKKDVEDCMNKLFDLLEYGFVKVCIGCVYLFILNGVMVFYYGLDVLLN